MQDDDPFGIKREELIVRSGVRNVFTPHTPIDSLDLFRGRNKQVRQLLEQMNTPGQHALLYGDRGVGKTSLANIVAVILSQLVGGRLHRKRCDSGETFKTIVAKPLRAAGVQIDALTSTRRTHKERAGGVKLLGVGGEMRSDRATVETFDASIDLQPSIVADYLHDHAGLLVIDEADAIPDAMDRRQLAELIKLLSDSNSKLKVLIVGIAETGGDLMGDHPSVQRCLKETKLDGMTDVELAAIITGGATELDLTFQDGVVTRIVRVSGGYPHFTHLLALKCAEEAIADKRPTVTPHDLSEAIRSAVDDAEGTLSRTYLEAIRSYSTDMYRIVLVAAAAISTTEFTAGDLRTAIGTETGLEIKQNSLNNYLNRLVSDGQETVLRRLWKGVYRFNDPRMPPYIKIANKQV